MPISPINLHHAPAAGGLATQLEHAQKAVPGAGPLPIFNQGGPAAPKPGLLAKAGDALAGVFERVGNALGLGGVEKNGEQLSGDAARYILGHLMNSKIPSEVKLLIAELALGLPEGSLGKASGTAGSDGKVSTKDKDEETSDASPPKKPGSQFQYPSMQAYMLHKQLTHQILMHPSNQHLLHNGLPAAKEVAWESAGVAMGLQRTSGSRAGSEHHGKAGGSHLDKHDGALLDGSDDHDDRPMLDKKAAAKAAAASKEHVHVGQGILVG